ncbi:DMT family transporter [Nguyenibacter sp. L1]|uniref:DMT family transporter n=1 Tax=Nguyenibacter sp. L1 TaxID=3049350 RepID=UPI002B49586C|nr:DMT family transporter [Nguyenibacter sp. L1]WRH86405.1 DMT family transporter [Nguyenibacter sp. L1]
MVVRPPREIGLIIAFVGAFLLSFDTLLLRMIGGDPLQIAFWRGVLMFVSGLFTSRTAKRIANMDLRMVNGPAGLVVAACYGLASVCFVTSALLTSVANMLVIVATAPLWAAIGSALLLQEATPARTWIASIFSFAGIILVMWPGLTQSLNTGDIIAFGAAVSMATAFVISRRSSENLALAPATGGLLSALTLVLFIPKLTFTDSYQYVIMALEGAILIPLALGLIAMAPRFLPAPQVGLFLLLETVLGPLWIWTILGEEPTRYALSGGALVILTLLAHSILSLGARPRPS